jgi:hypothetical protein
LSIIVEAGWFPDPAGRHDVRYWDGSRWTAEVSDGSDQAVDSEVLDLWAPPGSALKFANRSLLIVCLGMPVATVALVVWTLAIGTTTFDAGSVYGWAAFVKNLPVVLLMFALPTVGLIWGVRATRMGAGRNGTVAIWVAAAGLAWALIVTGFGGIQAAFGDTPDWTGFPLLVLQIALAAVVLAVSLVRARGGARSR